MSSSVSSGLLGSATLQQKAGLSFQEKQGYDHRVFLQKSSIVFELLPTCSCSFHCYLGVNMYYVRNYCLVASLLCSRSSISKTF